MKSHSHTKLMKHLTNLIALTTASVALAKSPTEWSFDHDDDALGWKAAQQLTPAAVSGGALTSTSTGNDPFFICGGLDIPTADFKGVTFRLKVQPAQGDTSSPADVAQLFWVAVGKENYSEEDSMPFGIVVDGQWHEYSIDLTKRATWAGRIKNLRFDPTCRPDVVVSIDSIKLTASVAGQNVANDPATQSEWTFDLAGDAQGWTPNNAMSAVTVVDGALTTTSKEEDPFILRGGLNIDAKSFSTVVVRMKLQGENGGPASDAGAAQLFWGTKAAPDCSEEASVRFDIEGDGNWHDYKVAVGENSEWKGTVTLLRLDPCDPAGVKVSIDSIKLQK